MLARPERLELPTPWFEARYSIQLSYGRDVLQSLCRMCGGHDDSSSTCVDWSQARGPITAADSRW